MREKRIMLAGFFVLLFLTSCTDKQTKKEIRQHAAAAEMQVYINQIKNEREQASGYLCIFPIRGAEGRKWNIFSAV